MSILTDADALIRGSRAESYGDPAKNLANIAKQWNAYLAQKYGVVPVITSEDICWMMADLKKCRQMVRRKVDNVIDAAGYIGLIEKVWEE